MNFNDAFDFVIGQEGAYSNNPADPGGETMWGITVTVARANGFAGPMKLMPKSVAQTIAKRQYWDAVHGDDLPYPIAETLFDAAYNSGPGQAIKWLQRALGVADDGKFGPITQAKAWAADVDGTAARINGLRLEFMTGLSTWPTFGKGWARRIAANLARINQ